MRNLQRLLDIVQSTIDVSEWEHDGIDWQEVADACMNDDQRLTVDEFCITLEVMTMNGNVYVGFGGKWMFKANYRTLEELNAALNYTIGVLEGHFNSNKHSLGCDIALKWLCKMNNETLSEVDMFDLNRFLPVKFR